MPNFIYNLFFVIISLYILIKAIAYGIYEIKQNKNNTGGITVIVFATIVVIFADIMMFIH